MVVEIRGASADVLPTLRDGDFDVVFLDGDHTFASVEADIGEAKRLVREGGIICGDDLERQADECDPETLARLIASGADSADDKGSGESFHPGVTVAVGEALGHVSAWDGFWAVRRREDSFETISMDGRKIEIPEHLTGAENWDEKLPLGYEVLEEFDQFNIIRDGNRLLGVNHEIGSVNIYKDRIGTRELEPYILIDDSVEALRDRIQTIREEQRAASAASHHVIVEEYEQFNIVRAGDWLCAVNHEIGEVNISADRIGTFEIPPFILIDESVEALRDRIQTIREEQKEASLAAGRILGFEEDQKMRNQWLVERDERIIELEAAQSERDARITDLNERLRTLMTRYRAPEWFRSKLTGE
jgi:SAM-dependent methyltransferase